MQSLFSVFRRSSAVQQQPLPPSQRRRSSAAGTTTSTPRHLDGSQSPSESVTGPPSALQNGVKAVPPPPRSRQVSSNAVPTLPPPKANGSPSVQQPLYLALYSQPDGSSGYRLALHLASSSNAKTVRKYCCTNAFSSPSATMSGSDETNISRPGDPYAFEATEVDTTTENFLLGRVLLGQVSASLATTKLNNHLDSFRLHPSNSVDSNVATKTWIESALSILRKDGILLETPTTIITPSALPPASSAPPPALPSTSTDKSKPPSNPPSLSRRPNLTTRETDQWNDIPENFLSADSTAGGSHRRKLRASTPRVTPKSSVGSMRNVSGGAPPGKEMQGRSWEEIVKVAEEWAGRVREEDGSGPRVRTLDLGTGREVVE